MRKMKLGEVPWMIAVEKLRDRMQARVYLVLKPCPWSTAHHSIGFLFKHLEPILSCSMTPMLTEAFLHRR
jgi:hypothetical protein